MIEIIQEYWRNYLYTDGYRFTGLAITLWLLVVSIGLGFCLSIPLAVARVSKRKWLAGLVWLYTYIFRGTPLYVQLLLCYTGLYSLEVIRNHELTNAFFRDGMHCTLLAFTLNTCAGFHPAAVRRLTSVSSSLRTMWPSGTARSTVTGAFSTRE